ncbi:MAG: MarR family winged helix-turn-helix transcriptional regulator [bacterium]|nr:MarR family winged helix-turn-helix transcriptional regulator [bacterium]
MDDQTKITPDQATKLNQACIADKLRLLNRVITSLYDDALSPIGITTSQMNILVVVAKYGEASPGQVGTWLSIEKSTLSRNVRLLRQNGWLDAIPGSGRSHTLRVTAKGAEILNKGLPLWERAQNKARSILGDSGVKEMARIADVVRREGRL